MANRSINHHIVPEVMQRQFSIDGDIERIWRAKKDSSGLFLNPEKKRVDKTFVIRDYYTIIENDQRSDLIERKFYGRIDDFLGRLLPNIIPILNSGEIPSFTPESLDSIRKVMLQMAKRTPDFLKNHDDTKLGKELVESTLGAIPNDAPSWHIDRLEADLADAARLRDRGRNIRVTATLKNSKLVEEALSEFVPRWAISETKHSYILSSMMVYRIGNGGPNGLSDPQMEMWMPITPKISLVLVRDPYKRVPHRVIDTPDHIRAVNEFAVKNSFEIASHSEALLKSLIGR